VTSHTLWKLLALALVLLLMQPSPGATQPTPAAPFSAMAGAWSGGGTISLSSGTRERLRCRASYVVADVGRSLELSIRCASDSYKFDLSSSVVQRRGRIYGRWSETANGVSGTVSGTATAGNIRASAESSAFTAGLSVTTSGNRQSVSITPRDTFITGVHITLSRSGR
jgi:hypothetical protein